MDSLDEFLLYKKKMDEFLIRSPATHLLPLFYDISLVLKILGWIYSTPQNQPVR
jgi:hypothetical protein